MSDGPKSDLQELISHQEAAFHLGLFAEILDIEIPTDDRYVRFFLSRIVEAIRMHKKQAAAYGVLVKALDSAVHGR